MIDWTLFSLIFVTFVVKRLLYLVLFGVQILTLRFFPPLVVTLLKFVRFFMASFASKFQSLAPLTPILVYFPYKKNWVVFYRVEVIFCLKGTESSESF